MSDISIQSGNVLNMDFSKAVIVNINNVPWETSPMKGVERRRLERVNAETGHTTSIVRFASDSYFPEHLHNGGEEFFVLEGVFSDHVGDFVAGYYVRNPPASSHMPFTKEGCTIFVKLCQMQSHGESQVNIDTRKQPWKEDKVDGCYVMPLFENEHEQVQLYKLEAGTQINEAFFEHGFEFLLLSGDITINQTPCHGSCWARFPKESTLSITTEKGCIFWNKQGHLT